MHILVYVAFRAKRNVMTSGFRSRTLRAEGLIQRYLKATNTIIAAEVKQNVMRP
jgi:hypothetical protein